MKKSDAKRREKETRLVSVFKLKLMLVSFYFHTLMDKLKRGSSSVVF